MYRNYLISRYTLSTAKIHLFPIYVIDTKVIKFKRFFESEELQIGPENLFQFDCSNIKEEIIGYLLGILWFATEGLHTIFS